MALTKNYSIPQFSLFWYLYWMLAMGFFIVVLKNYQIDYTNAPFISLAYYLAASGLGYFLFGQKFNISKLIFIFTIAASVYLLSTYFIFVYFPPITSTEQIIKSQLMFSLLVPKTGMAKLSEIFFQQVMIFSFLNFLKENMQDKSKIITLFSVIFFVIHLPLFYNFGLTGIVLVLPALFAGILFSLIYVHCRNPIIWCSLVHVSFYFILALVIRYTEFLLILQ